MGGKPQRQRLEWVVFAGASAASAALILVVSRGTTFSGDEWGILFRLAHGPLSTALFEPPPDKYLIAVPTLLYGALAESFGAGSYLPYRVLGAALIVLAAGLFLALAKRRVSIALALPCSVLLLFLGAAGEVVAIPGRVPSQVAICAGLALLLALDRRDRTGDLVACGFGTLAVLSHPIGLAFAGAAAVIVLFGRPRGWTRSWIFLVPLAVYGLWWLTLRQTQEHSAVTLGNVLSFAWHDFVALCATLTGIFRPPLTDTVDFSTVASRAVAILAIVGFIFALMRARRISVGLAAALAALVFSLVAPPLAPGGLEMGLRDAAAARYIYPGTILLLLVIVETVAMGPRLPVRAAVAGAALAAAVFFIGLASNVVQLVKGAPDLRRTSEIVKAELGALDLTRSGREPASDEDLTGSAPFLAFVANFTTQGRQDLVPGAAPAYYLVRDKYGSPAYGASAIRVAPLFARQQADRVLIAALGVRLEPAAAVDANPSRRVGGIGSRRQGRRCRHFAPKGAGNGASQDSVEISSPAGRALIEARRTGPPTTVVGRLTGEPVETIAWPPFALRAASLDLPDLGLAGTPWRLLVTGAAGVTYCRAADGRRR